MYLQFGASSSWFPISEYFCTFGRERGFFDCLQAMAMAQNTADSSKSETITPTNTYKTDQSEILFLLHETKSHASFTYHNLLPRIPKRNQKRASKMLHICRLWCLNCKHHDRSIYSDTLRYVHRQTQFLK